ncbi:MAG: ABC transporter permease [Usitatibacteraceae bacterium]
MMREVVTRFGRENLGALWLVAEPMIFTLGVTTLWTVGGLNHGGTGMPIVAFAVTGYSSVLLWRNCANHSLGAIDSNSALLYHRNVKVFDVLLTRSVLEIAGASGSYAILATSFTLLGWMSWPVDLLQVLFGWILLAWFGTAVAFVIGAGTAYSEIVERLWGPTSYLLFPLSGAAFMVDWLPPALQKVVLLIPMVHGLEIMREGYFGNTVRTHYDVGYFVICCMVLSLFGMYLVRDAGNRVNSR